MTKPNIPIILKLDRKKKKIIFYISQRIKNFTLSIFIYLFSLSISKIQTKKINRVCSLVIIESMIQWVEKIFQKNRIINYA